MTAKRHDVPGSGGAQLASPQRLVSLDALRGFDMILIVGAEEIVNGVKRASTGPTAKFLVAQFTHKDWEGFGFYDLIFPLFVFLAGVSLVFSLDKALERGGPGAAVGRLSRRALLLYLLGVFYYGGIANGWGQIRWVGVLQRIAISYFCAALLYLACGRRWKPILISTGAILVTYWAILTFVPTPGRSSVSFAEGENIANYVDSRYLPGKRWDGEWDPEGLLSSLPAVASCTIGLLAGLFLRTPSVSPERKAVWMAVCGGALVVAGFGWGEQLPVIKKLWTSSYVLVAGGYSLLLLSGFYLVIDVWGMRRGIGPLLWVGANALTIYMAQNMVDFLGLAKRLAGGEIAERIEPWGEALIATVAMLMLLGLARFLYRRGIFLRV